MLFSAADGRRRWVRQLTGTLRPLAWAGDTLGRPVRRNARYGRSTHDDGSTEWEWSLGGAPVGVAGDADRVYITALDNVLRAVNRGNGHQRWQQTLLTRALLAPVAFDGAVLVAGLSPPLALFNTQTGIPIGIHTAPGRAGGSPARGPVGPAGDRVDRAWSCATAG